MRLLEGTRAGANSSDFSARQPRPYFRGHSLVQNASGCLLAARRPRRESQLSDLLPLLIPANGVSNDGHRLASSQMHPRCSAKETSWGPRINETPKGSFCVPLGTRGAIRGAPNHPQCHLPTGPATYPPSPRRGVEGPASCTRPGGRGGQEKAGVQGRCELQEV